MSQMENLAILLSLLLAGVLGEENTKPMFTELGEDVEMGFCFGEYIAVYRITATGRELLGESVSPVSPPESFKGRISITSLNDGLLGLKIMNLQFSDSGIYIRECMVDANLDNHRTHLYVCGERMNQQDIFLTSGTGANLVCKADNARKASQTVKWYREVHNATVFLDTKISLEPLQADFKGHVQVKDNGSLLHVSDDFIKDRPNFACLVMDGEQCLSFQTIGLPEEPDIKSIYRSVGENVNLTCSVNHLRQSYWETPFGQVNSSKPISFKETTGSQIFVANDLKIGHYPLVIRSLTSNHSGMYKCYSTFLVEDYIVNVCPVHASSNVSFSTEDKKVSLKCRYMTELQLIDKTDHVSVLWMRKSDGEDVLIIDTEDPSLHMPKDLKGRVTYSKKDSSLVITNPMKEDSGTYWCVVLLDNDKYAASENDTDHLMELSNDQEEESGWFMDEEYMGMCVYRQVTNLSFQVINVDSKSIKTDEKSYKTDEKSNKTDEKSNKTDEKSNKTDEKFNKTDDKSNLTMYAVCGGVVALLGLIGIVVGIKMRAKKTASSNQREGNDPSEEEGWALATNSSR